MHHNSIEQPIPGGQEWLYEVMERLGYPLHKAGICFGINAMFMHAVLNNKVPEFNKRLHFIYQYGKEIDAGKVREIYKNREYQTNQHAKDILDAVAFLEGVELNFNPTAYLELFDKALDKNQDYQETLFLTQPIPVKDDKTDDSQKNQFSKVGNLTGTYNRHRLELLLNELKSISAMQASNEPICYTLDAKSHSTSLAYHNNQWIAFDVNRSPVKFFKSNDIASVAKFVHDGYQFKTQYDEHISFHIEAFVNSNNNNKNIIKEKIISIQNNVSIHDVKNIYIEDADKITWLSKLAETNNIELAKKIINSNSEINLSDLIIGSNDKSILNIYGPLAISLQNLNDTAINVKVIDTPSDSLPKDGGLILIKNKDEIQYQITNPSNNEVITGSFTENEVKRIFGVIGLSELAKFDADNLEQYFNRILAVLAEKHRIIYPTISDIFIDQLIKENIVLIFYHESILKHAVLSCSPVQFDHLIDKLNISQKEMIDLLLKPGGIIYQAALRNNQGMLEKFKSYCLDQEDIDLRNKLLEAFYKESFDAVVRAKNTTALYDLIQEIEKLNFQNIEIDDPDLLDIANILNSIDGFDKTANNKKIKIDFDIADEDEFKNSDLLFIASKYGNEKLARKLISMNIDVNKCEFIQEGVTNTALMVAARRGNTQIVELLLNHGAKLNLKNFHGNTALHIACESGYEDIVEVFMKDKNYDALLENALNNRGKTALMLACEKNRINVIKLFIDNILAKCHGNTQGYIDANKNSFLHFVCKNIFLKDHIIKIIKEQIQLHPDDSLKFNNEGETPLELAIKSGDAEIANLMLSSLSSDQLKNITFTVDGEKCGILHMLLLHNMNQLAQQVTHLCPDIVNARTQKDAQTPLMIAAFCGSQADVYQEYLLSMDVLLKNGADLNCLDRRGKSILHYACQGNCDAIVEFILSSNPKLINVVDNKNRTALMTALDGVNINSINCLLKRDDVDLFVVDNNQHGALWCACRGNLILPAKHILDRIIQNSSDSMAQLHFQSIIDLPITNDNAVIFQMMLESNKASLTQAIDIMRQLLSHYSSTTNNVSSKLAGELLNYIEKYQFIFNANCKARLDNFKDKLVILTNPASSRHDQVSTNTILSNLTDEFSLFVREQLKMLNETLLNKVTSEDIIKQKILKQLNNYLATHPVDAGDIKILMQQVNQQSSITFEDHLQKWLKQSSSNQSLLNYFQPKSVAASISKETQLFIDEMKDVAIKMRSPLPEVDLKMKKQ